MTLGIILLALAIATIVAIYFLFIRGTRRVDEEPALGIGAVQLPTRGCPYGYDNDPLASKDHFTAAQAYTELADKILDQDLIDLDDPSYHDHDCIKLEDWDEECDCTYSWSLEDLLEDSDGFAGLSPEFTPQNPIPVQEELTPEAQQWAAWVKGCNEARANARFDRTMSEIHKAMNKLKY